jgi:diguanylate cyclase (GGDEF)-like protein/PAS domain S-box-containing protein
VKRVRTPADVSQELLVDPRRFRLFLAALLVGGLTLIGATFQAGLSTLHNTAEADLLEELDAKTLLLEEQLARSLDSVAARVAAADAPISGQDKLPNAEELRALLADDRMVRSLSLIDSVGRIKASSNPDNIGTQVPLRLMPEPLRAGLGGLQFGALVAGRDLVDAARTVTTSSAGPLGAPAVAPSSGVEAPREAREPTLWIASAPSNHLAAGTRWVMALNPDVLSNLWVRVAREREIQIGVFDFRGTCLLSHPKPVDCTPEWGLALSQRAQNQAIGLFNPRESASLRVSYRASAQHPLILAVWADQRVVLAGVTPGRQVLATMALLSVASLLVLLGLLWRWYRRYVASAVDGLNRSRAVDAHLLTSIWTADGELIDCNEALVRVSGYSREELIGSRHTVFKSDVHEADFYQQLRHTLEQGAPWAGTLCLSKKDGSLYWVNATIQPYLNASARLTNYIALFTDITESKALLDRLALEQHLREELRLENENLSVEAVTDPLTQLPNRRALDNGFAALRRAPHGPDDTISLLLLDLDHFKSINDTHGHLAGDVVLKEMAQRWTHIVRSSDLIVRMGGEEFCVVLPHTNAEQAMRVAQKMRRACCDTPVAVDLPGQRLSLEVTVSIGVCSHPMVSQVALSQLIHDADDALYAAKRRGRNQCVAWQPGLLAAA